MTINLSTTNNAPNLTLPLPIVPRGNQSHALVVDGSQRLAVSPTDAQPLPSAVVCLSDFTKQDGTYTKRVPLPNPISLAGNPTAPSNESNGHDLVIYAVVVGALLTVPVFEAYGVGPIACLGEPAYGFVAGGAARVAVRIPVGTIVEARVAATRRHRTSR